MWQHSGHDRPGGRLETFREGRLRLTWLLRMSRARCCSSITSLMSLRVLRPNANRDCCNWPADTHTCWTTDGQRRCNKNTRRGRNLPQTECFSSRSSLTVMSQGMEHVSRPLPPSRGFWALTVASGTSSLIISDRLKRLMFPVLWQERSTFRLINEVCSWISQSLGCLIRLRVSNRNVYVNE